MALVEREKQISEIVFKKWKLELWKFEIVGYY